MHMGWSIGAMVRKLDMTYDHAGFSCFPIHYRTTRSYKMPTTIFLIHKLKYQLVLYFPYSSYNHFSYVTLIVCLLITSSVNKGEL